MPKRQKSSVDIDVPDPLLDDSKEYHLQDSAYDTKDGGLAHTSMEFNLPRSPVKKKSRHIQPAPSTDNSQSLGSFTVSDDVGSSNPFDEEELPQAGPEDIPKVVGYTVSEVIRY